MLSFYNSSDEFHYFNQNVLLMVKVFPCKLILPTTANWISSTGLRSKVDLKPGAFLSFDDFDDFLSNESSYHIQVNSQEESIPSCVIKAQLVDKQLSNLQFDLYFRFIIGHHNLISKTLFSPSDGNN